MLTLPDGSRQRISGTPPVNTKASAEAAERAHIELVLRGVPLQSATREESPTLRDYAEVFIECYRPGDKPSAKKARSQILSGYIVSRLGHLRLGAIQQSHIDKLVADLLPGRSRKTVNNITAVLSSLMRYAARNKLIDRDQLEDLKFEIKSQDSEMVAVSAVDVCALAEAADARYRVAILLAADAGLRVGEIRALTWDSINELTREITISQSFDRSGELTETKGRKRRVVPISARLWLALKGVSASSCWVMPKLKLEGPLGYDAIREGIHKVYKKAEVERPSKPWHALRHTFGSELASAGVPVHTIQSLMGHASIETTLRYMHTNREAKREAIAKLVANIVPTAESEKIKAP